MRRIGMRDCGRFALMLGVMAGVSGAVIAGDVPCIFPELAGAFDTAGSARASVIDGDYLYVADGAAGLVAFDISDLSNPMMTDAIDTAGNAFDLRLVGDLLYLADDAGGLLVFDVGVDGSLALVGSFVTGGRAFGIDVVGTTVYLADRENGLVVLDATLLGTITQIGQYVIPGGAFVLDVVVEGDYAYLAAGNGGSFEIVDVSDPSSMSRVGGLAGVGAFGTSVDHDGSVVYLADSVDGVSVIDASNPAAPVLMDSLDIGSPRSVTAQGALVYAGNNSDGMIILDASDPMNLAVFGEYDTAGNAFGVGVSGSVACIGDFFSGIQLVNLNLSECLSDMNGDCQLNFLDVSEFLSLFSVQDPRVDFMMDGSFNFLDVSVFLSEFSGGCP